jgi:cytochrome c biogenesis protein CcmG/thiol:disulfide interchange protein DsbE
VASRRLPVSWILSATALALVAAAVVVVLAGVGSGESGSGDGSDAGTESPSMELTPEADLPESVHAIELAALDDGGATRTLHELMDGRPLVLNFFASWCQPCIEEMPAFERVHQAVGDQVTVVGLAMRDRPDNARDIVATTGVTYPTYADPDGAALAYFEALNMPTTVFLAPDGEVLEVRSEPFTEAQLRDKLDEHYGVAA